MSDRCLVVGVVKHTSHTYPSFSPQVPTGLPEYPLLHLLFLAFVCRLDRHKEDMDPYVAVTNDASLAVKSIIQMKKAFWTQTKCIENLLKQNKSLQQTIAQLEVRNKELRTFATILTQNKDLQKKVTKLESDKLTLSNVW